MPIRWNGSSIEAILKQLLPAGVYGNAMEVPFADATRIRLYQPNTNGAAWFDVPGLLLAQATSIEAIVNLLEPLVEEALFHLEWMKDDDDTPEPYWRSPESGKYYYLPETEFAQFYQEYPPGDPDGR